MKLSNFQRKAIAPLAVILASLIVLPMVAKGQQAALGTNDSCMDPDYTNQLNTVYRSWNPNLIDHFFTNNADENGTGYQKESSGWGVLAQQQQATVPLYRYWGNSVTDHFYSTSAQTPAGYVSEGIIGYIFPNSVPGSIPLYRFYRHINGSPANGDHLYTVSDERNDVSKYGYHEEGIEGYVCPMPLTQ